MAGQLTPPLNSPSPLTSSHSLWGVQVQQHVGQVWGGAPPVPSLLPSSPPQSFWGPETLPVPQDTPQQNTGAGRWLLSRPEWWLRTWEPGEPEETPTESRQPSWLLPPLPLCLGPSPQTVMWPHLMGFSTQISPYQRVSPEPCIEWLGPPDLPGTPHSSLITRFSPQGTYHCLIYYLSSLLSVSPLQK